MAKRKKTPKAEFEYRESKLKALLDDPRLSDAVALLPLFIPLYRATAKWASNFKDTDVDGALRLINNFLDRAPRTDDRETIRRLKLRLREIIEHARVGSTSRCG